MCAMLRHVRNVVRTTCVCNCFTARMPLLGPGSAHSLRHSLVHKPFTRCHGAVARRLRVASKSACADRHGLGSVSSADIPVVNQTRQRPRLRARPLPVSLFGRSNQVGSALALRARVTLNQAVSRPAATSPSASSAVSPCPPTPHIPLRTSPTMTDTYCVGQRPRAADQTRPPNMGRQRPPARRIDPSAARIQSEAGA